MRCGETCVRRTVVGPSLLYDKIFSHSYGTGRAIFFQGTTKRARNYLNQDFKGFIFE